MPKGSTALLIFALLLLSSLAPSICAQSAISATWRVQKYDIAATLPSDDRSRSISVRSVVTVRNVSSAPASTLSLRLTTLADVTAVKLGDSTASFTKSDEKLGPSVTFQKIAIRVPGAAHNTSVTATLEYTINLKDNSPLAALSPAGSQFLPLSYWYPTPNNWFFTRGPDTAPLTLKITAPSGVTVVASGASNGGSFEQKLGVEPFFLANNWDIADESGVTVYLPKGSGPDGQKRAAELAALFTDAKKFVSDMLGKAPEVPLRIVSSTRAAGFSDGGTVIVDDAVFRRPKIDSLTAMNIAEAAVKLWIGNSVSVDGDAYGIVSEGLTRYLATQFIESEYGKAIADVERLRQRSAYAAISRRDAPMSTVAPLDDFYFAEVANKGSMAWRILAKRVGVANFATVLRQNMQDGNLNLAELRQAFPEQKSMTDYLFDKVTDMDLMVGVPEANGSDTRSALRNTGSIDATVDVTATTTTGEKVTTSATIRAESFGDVTFKTNGKVDRVEIDVDKLYPQTDYADDVAPRVSTVSDPLLAAKELFDKTDFGGAETIARKLLVDRPQYDDLRIILARSLAAEGRSADAEREYKSILDQKLLSARSMAWAYAGLADLAAKANQNDAAAGYAEAAIRSDGDIGASLIARNARSKIPPNGSIDSGIKAFFADFDKAAVSNRKADVEALVLPGEVTRFASGVSGSTQQWQTDVRRVDQLSPTIALVEANVSVKLLNKNPQSGMAVFRLVKTSAGWRLQGVDSFNVQ